MPFPIAHTDPGWAQSVTASNVGHCVDSDDRRASSLPVDSGASSTVMLTSGDLKALDDSLSGLTVLVRQTVAVSTCSHVLQAILVVSANITILVAACAYAPVVVAVHSTDVIIRHAESQPNYAELLAKHFFALHSANRTASTLDDSLNSFSQLNHVPLAMIWATWLCAISFVLSLFVATLSFVAPIWLARYREVIADASATIPYHTWILVSLVAPALRPALYLSLPSLVTGIAAYLSTTDSNLMIVIIILLALFCLGFFALKISDLMGCKRLKHLEPDHERGTLPASPRPPRRNPRPGHNSDTNSDDPSDHDEDWPSGGNAGHQQRCVNCLETPPSTSDFNDTRGQHWDVGSLQTNLMRSLDALLLFVSEQHDRRRDTD